MTSGFKYRTARWLLAAGLAAGVATAYAANGFNVTANQEAQVKTGMSADEVRAAIGRPDHVTRYYNEPGPTWAYNVPSARGVGAGESVVFYVDFGADGRVTTAEQQIVDNGD